MVDSTVIRIAREAHQKLWEMSGDESRGDKLAAAVTREWQNEVIRILGARFKAEHPIAEGLNERIDLVDLEHGVAYEMKVSPNNDHHEFYRDLFKTLVAKDHAIPNIGSFCFLCPQIAARRYEKGLRHAVLQEGPRLGFDIHIVSL